jgi:hypothetical protein
MWFVWTLITFVVLSWVGYRWTKTLITKYEHTTESIAVLAVLFILANYTGLRLTYVMIPVLNIWPRLVVMLPIGFIIFVGFSYVAVNLWCSFLTRDFDERMGVLEEEKDNLQRQIDMLRWRHVTQAPFDYPEEAELSPEESSDEIQRLREFLESWQQVGSAARVRSIKVSEWKSQAEHWEDGRLKAEINLLKALAEEETDESKREQMKARLAVFEIQLRSRERSHKRSAEIQDRVAGERSKEIGPEAIRRRLQDIHAEIQLVEGQKRDFLRGKVRLGWRVRP